MSEKPKRIFIQKEESSRGSPAGRFSFFVHPARTPRTKQQVSTIRPPFKTLLWAILERRFFGKNTKIPRFYANQGIFSFKPEKILVLIPVPAPEQFQDFL